MVEVMKLYIGDGKTYLRQEHYVQDISEITPVVGLLSSTQKKGRS